MVFVRCVYPSKILLVVNAQGFELFFFDKGFAKGSFAYA
jgi:hypothetical protein